jgi:hypothetical protein
LAVPSIDAEALSAAGHDVGLWPEDAAGDFDGAAPAPARLLLLADPQGAAALAALGPAMDFLDVDPDNEAHLKAAADGAMALSRLTSELAEQGQRAIADRLKAVLDRELTDAELEALSARLSPDLLSGYRNRWFADAAEAEAPVDDRESQRARVPAGGWIRDDQTLSLRYHPAGHADPWMTAWLDVLAEAASSSRKGIADVAQPLLRDALKPTAPGQCGSCHRLEQAEGGRQAIQWRPLAPDAVRRGFTTFNHAPHVIDPQLSDCASCHRIEASAANTAPSADATTAALTSGFAPISKGACVACHVPRAAGDSCTQCHRYHGGVSGEW